MNMFKSNGGFTLVELIVVIAILAILSGIAIPAYSGYIAKAEAAQDDAVIDACRKALASACAMEGEDVSGYELSYTRDSDNDITGVTITGTNAADVAAEFKLLIEGNGLTVSP